MKIEINNLSKSFENMKILDNISLNLKCGEFVSIIGPSGCGKSTIFKLLTSMEKEFFGEIKMEGIDIKKYEKEIAYMPQKDLLFPWRTLFENLLLPSELKKTQNENAKNKVTELIEEFGLKGFEASYPNELSGGMRQRAALIRTALVDSSILLLDEPFGALDAITRVKMQKWLLKLLEKLKHSVLFITHDIDEAMFLSDRIYILSDRPAKILKEIKISENKPRDREFLLSEKALSYKKEILRYLEY